MNRLTLLFSTIIVSISLFSQEKIYYNYEIFSVNNIETKISENPIDFLLETVNWDELKSGQKTNIRYSINFTDSIIRKYNGDVLLAYSKFIIDTNILLNLGSSPVICNSNLAVQYFDNNDNKCIFVFIYDFIESLLLSNFSTKYSVHTPNFMNYTIFNNNTVKIEYYRSYSY